MIPETIMTNFRRLPETADNLLEEYSNGHDVTLAKAIHVDAQQSKGVRMDNLA
jgi:hypothetical protein